MKTVRVTISEQGRIIIPVKMRKQLRMQNNTFVVSVEGNSLRLTPIEETVQKLQEIIASGSNADGQSGTEALFAMRRAEFAKEQADIERYQKEEGGAE